jgi:hypothetical protein
VCIDDVITDIDAHLRPLGAEALRRAAISSRAECCAIPHFRLLAAMREEGGVSWPVKAADGVDGAIGGASMLAQASACPTGHPGGV